MRQDGRTWVVATGTVFFVFIGGSSAVTAVGGGPSSGGGPPAAGGGVPRAEEAALAETGGGRVTDTEVGDEDSYYEVEITSEDGSQVDVQLDESFAVVGTVTHVENVG
jgi:hypothetical protein